MATTARISAPERPPELPGGLPPGQAFQRLVGEIFRLNGALLAAGERFGHDLGISPARWQTIATLRDGPLTVSQIARRLGLARQSVQRTVNLLLAEGLVRTRPNPAHRRAPLVMLSRRGRAMMGTLRERQWQLSQAFTAGLGLSDADLAALSDTLRSLRETGQQAASDEDAG